MSEKVIKLSSPITAHGETLSEISLRVPTPADARKVKSLPYVMGADESVNLNVDVCAKYVELLAQIPPSSIEQLAMSDFNTLCWEVAGFFMGSGSEASTS